MVLRVERIEGHVPRLEVDHRVGSCADGLQVIRGVASLLSFIGADEMLGEDLATHATEGVIPERRGFPEHDSDRMLIEGIDVLNIYVAATGDRTGRGVSGILPGEDDIVSREGCTIVPDDPLFQVPGDR